MSTQVLDGCKTTLSSGISSTDTSIPLTDGSDFPATASGYFWARVYCSSDYTDPMDDPQTEEMFCTNRAGNTLTVVRGLGHNTAYNHKTGGKTYTVILASGLSSMAGIREFNVRVFGATGDGSTDDTSAIQDAIDYAEAINGCVFFPAGTYLISDELVIDDRFVYVRGEGKKASIIYQTGSAKSCLKLQAGDITIKDIQLQGSKGTSGIGLEFDTLTHAATYTGASVCLVNVVIQQHGSYGIAFTGGSSGDVQTASYLTFIDVDVGNNDSWCVYADEYQQVNTISFYNCTMQGPSDYIAKDVGGIWLELCQAVNVYGGSYQQMTGCIRVGSGQDSRSTVISGAYFETFSKYGVYLDSYGGWTTHGVAITGNFFACGTLAAGVSAACYFRAADGYAAGNHFGSGGSGKNYYEFDLTTEHNFTIANIYDTILDECVIGVGVRVEYNGKIQTRRIPCEHWASWDGANDRTTNLHGSSATYYSTLPVKYLDLIDFVDAYWYTDATDGGLTITVYSRDATGSSAPSSVASQLKGQVGLCECNCSEEIHDDPDTYYFIKVEVDGGSDGSYSYCMAPYLVGMV